MNREQTVIEFVRLKARRVPAIRRVVLFGSRGRGDGTERSDFDFAVYSEPMTEGAWARFSLEVEEEAPTLCGIDLVRASGDLSADLRAAIEQKGRVIYDAEGS